MVIINLTQWYNCYQMNINTICVNKYVLNLSSYKKSSHLIDKHSFIKNKTKKSSCFFYLSKVWHFFSPFFQCLNIKLYHSLINYVGFAFTKMLMIEKAATISH